MYLIRTNTSGIKSAKWYNTPMDAINTILQLLLSFLLQFLTLIINFFISILQLILSFAQSIVGAVH